MPRVDLVGVVILKNYLIPTGAPGGRLAPRPRASKFDSAGGQD